MVVNGANGTPTWPPLAMAVRVTGRVPVASRRGSRAIATAKLIRPASSLVSVRALPRLAGAPTVSRSIGTGLKVQAENTVQSGVK